MFVSQNFTINMPDPKHALPHLTILFLSSFPYIFLYSIPYLFIRNTNGSSFLLLKQDIARFRIFAMFSPSILLMRRAQFLSCAWLSLFPPCARHEIRRISSAMHPAQSAAVLATLSMFFKSGTFLEPAFCSQTLITDEHIDS